MMDDLGASFKHFGIGRIGRMEKAQASKQASKPE
jgi:hypothetical protein